MAGTAPTPPACSTTPTEAACLTDHKSPPLASASGGLDEGTATSRRNRLSSPELPISGRFHRGQRSMPCAMEGKNRECANDLGAVRYRIQGD